MKRPWWVRALVFLLVPRRFTITVFELIAIGLIVAGTYWFGESLWFRIPTAVVAAAYWLRLVHVRKAQRGSYEFFFAGLMVLVLLGLVIEALGIHL